MIKKAHKHGAVKPELDEAKIVNELAHKLSDLDQLDRHTCRQDFESHFTLDQMVKQHIKVYRKLAAIK